MDALQRFANLAPAAVPFICNEVHFACSFADKLTESACILYFIMTLYAMLCCYTSCYVDVLYAVPKLYSHTVW